MEERNTKPDGGTLGNGQTPPDVEPFKPDYRIVILSLAGLAGFIAGFFFMAYPELTNPGLFSNFHEVIYNPRQIAREAFGEIKQSLKARIDKARDSVTFYTKKKLD